ncbi:MAG: hypothetical protein HOJ88_11880 [Proteobacteria bacterium]|nr:hypothetical protein [Pseudomonadota bacterium]
MRSISKLLITTIISVLVLTPIAVTAHHSMSEFNRDVIEEVEGTVSKVSWKNPHILLEVTRTDAAGADTVYYLEASAVSSLRRRGLTGDEVKVGDAVRIAGWPSDRRDNYIQANHILLPSGVELLVGGPQEPRWADDSVGGDRDVLDADRIATATGDGIFRIWSQGSRAWFFTGRSGYQLNEAATAAAAAWDDIADNPIVQCIPPGMPGLMGNPYPMEFTQVGDNIELHFEEFDAMRTIHMGDNVADPADVPPSHLGYSVGHWEGETLVVDTTRVNWPYFNRSGAPQTENVKINERFTVQEDGYRLEWILTVDEPATLVEPFVLDGYFVWKPGEAINPYECTLEDWASNENTL